MCGSLSFTNLYNSMLDVLCLGKNAGTGMDGAETSLSQLGALVSEFHAPLDKILTTSEHLDKVSRGTTSRINVCNLGRSHKSIGVECKVKVRNQGQIIDHLSLLSHTHIYK